MRPTRTRALGAAAFVAITAVLLGRPDPARTHGRAASMNGPGMSEVTVVNLGTAGTTGVIATFVTQAPRRPPIGVDLPSIRPVSARSAFVPDLATIPTGAYAVVLEGDRAPLGAVVRTEWPRSGGAVIANAQVPWTGGRTIVPLVTARWQGQDSYLSVQRADPELRPGEAVIDVDVLAADSPGVVASTRIALDAPWRSVTIPLSDPAGPLALPDGFVGWAVVSAGGPVAAQVLTDLTASEKGAYGFEGIADGGLSNDLLAASVHSARRLKPNETDSPIRDTRLAIVNPGEADATVAVSYVGRVGSCVAKPYSQSIAVPAGRQVLVGRWPGMAGTDPLALPRDCSGTARLRSIGAPIAAVAVEAIDDGSPAGELAGAYTLASAADAARRLVIPSARRGDTGLVTGIHAMNAGTTTARAEIAFYRTDGEAIDDCGERCRASIAPGAAVLWWTGSIPSLPRGYLGYAVVTSDEPLDVAISEESETDWGFDLALYRALAVQTGARWQDLPDEPIAGQPYLPLVLDVAEISSSLPAPTPRATATPTAPATSTAPSTPETPTRAAAESPTPGPTRPPFGALYLPAAYRAEK